MNDAHGICGVSLELPAACPTYKVIQRMQTGTATVKGLQRPFRLALEQYVHSRLHVV
jgi:hypothetical protein